MKNFEIKNNGSLATCGRERQSGRSMIEMLGVLAIIGVLSVGGIAGYSKAMQKYRTNKTIEQITLIAGNIRSFFAPQKSYAGLSSYSDTGKAIIKKAKLVPDEMWDGD
ncbi:MAG: prepilin-type N-terminal cleavage/methylation domain-containing protein, partial [Alphaproteobacteria bacterium]|nr:prepilin-type N-terminal cleavage/methylation domain-containing protein [Alphaproteobacteria bacterium]